MAKILVIEDHPPSRDFLVQLLRYRSFEVIEAADGRQGLEIARRERPDLVFTDVLMPAMDGFELARRIRADAPIAATPILFYTASHHRSEARTLAEECGIARFLIKPADPEAILAVVDEVLGATPEALVAPPGPSFDDAHRTLLTDELQSATIRLDALVGLNLKLASERDPRQLFEKLCRGSRDLIPSTYAFAATTGDDAAGGWRHLAGAGFEADTVEGAALWPRPEGLFARVLAAGTPLRAEGAAADAELRRLFPAVSPVTSLLVAPISTATDAYGWLCLAGRLGAERYGESDQRIAEALGAAAAVSCESLRRYAALQRSAERLSLLHTIDRAILSAQSPEQIAAACASQVRRLVRCERVAVLRFDEALEHATILAQDPEGGPGFPAGHRLPLAALGDVSAMIEDLRRGLPHALDLARSPRRTPDVEAMLAIGIRHYLVVPLNSLGTLVGALSLRIPRPDALGAEAREIALEVGAQVAIALQEAAGRQRTEEAERARRASEERYRCLVELSPEAIALYSGERFVYANPAAAEIAGVSSPAELVGRDVFDFVPAEGLEIARARVNEIASGAAQRLGPLEEEIVRADGERRHVEITPIATTYQGAPAVQLMVRDVTAQRRAERELREALRRAEAADRLKSSFLANMSHEIRTPLNVIIGFAGFLASELPADQEEELRPLFDGVKRASLRLLDTVHGVLDIAKLETGTFEVRPSPVRLCKLLRKAAEEFEPLARKNGVAFALEVEEPKAAVVFDEYCLSTTLHHLLDNAIKFTPRGSVTVRLRRSGSRHFLLEVEDTGVGIGESYFPRLFEPFTQEESGRTRHYEGSGLGLALAKRFVELGGGRISLSSTKGRGTKVTIEVPASDEARAPEEELRSE